MARRCLAACAFRFLLAEAQSGECTGRGGIVNVVENPCSLTGASSTYTESINGDVRKIMSAGCPNNNPLSVCIGDNPNPANTQNWDISIPATPQFLAGSYEASLAQKVSLASVGGIIGVTLNGVEIRSCYAGSRYGACVDFDTSASAIEGDTFERGGGHGNPFHYHGAPVFLIQQLGPRSDCSSKQLGWSFDGFPMYGNRGPGGVLIKRCGTFGADSKYCADECGGYYGEDYDDNFKYRYFLMGPDGDLTSDPIKAAGGAEYFTAEYFPFSPLCFLGCGTVSVSVSTSDIGNSPVQRALRTCSSEASAGTVIGYSPQAMIGITDQYEVGQETISNKTCAPTANATTPYPTTGVVSGARNILCAWKLSVLIAASLFVSNVL